MQGQRRLLSHNLSALLLRAGLHAEAAEVALETAALAAGAGDPVLRAVALSLRADALRRTGDLEGALRSIGEADRLQRERGDRNQSTTLLRRAEILDSLGRPEEARADAREARTIAEQHGEPAVVATADLWVALHQARRGDATVPDLRRALAGARAVGAGTRALTQSLIAETEAWLAACAVEAR
jgi:tetratricopeptide (TPR) repeat protein